MSNIQNCNCNNKIDRKTTLIRILLGMSVRYITNKIRKLIFKLYELRIIFTFKTIKSVYHALIESIIHIGIVVWGSAGSTILKKVEVAQKWI